MRIPSENLHEQVLPRSPLIPPSQHRAAPQPFTFTSRHAREGAQEQDRHAQE